MSPLARRASGAAVAALVTLGIGAASRVPWPANTADEALLRLSWRAQSETEEHCRPLTEEEKAKLPIHMQVPEVCESRAMPYLLRVAIDGSVALADTVHGAGAREDRPIYVFRELALDPGRHALDVEFRPIDSTPDDGGVEQAEVEADGEKHEDARDERDDDEPEGTTLRFAESVQVREREVLLLAYDPQRRALVRVD